MNLIRALAEIFGAALVETLKQAHARGVKITLLVSANIYAGCDCFAARVAYAELTKAGITVRKSSPTCTHYQHQKFSIVDEVDVAWSTGNWDNADYPSVSGHSQVVIGPIPNASWTKANRDFTVYVDDNENLAAHFREVMEKDSSSPSASDWQPWSDIQCGPADAVATTMAPVAATTATTANSGNTTAPTTAAPITQAPTTAPAANSTAPTTAAPITQAPTTATTTMAPAAGAN